MQRALARATSALVVGAVATIGLSACSDEPSTRSRIESARLQPVERVVPVPPARFSRTSVAATSLEGSTAALDRCAGPIAVQLGDDRPVLLAEHDYCGGSAWISRLDLQDVVKLDGPGLEADSYVVTEIMTERRGEAQVRDLPAADVVLQTCISPGEIVLVAVEKFQPALVS